MDLKYFIFSLGLLVASVFAGMALAQQDQSSPPMSLAPITASAGVGSEATIPVDDLVKRLRLSIFEVVAGDLMNCPDQQCLNQMQFFSALKCAANKCAQSDQGAGLDLCFGDFFGKYSTEQKGQISRDMCSVINSSNPDSRQVLLGHFKDINESLLVNIQASVQALNGSASACEAVIKDYVGRYGSHWTYEWYRSLSGCRIVAHERTRAEEENDFAAWFSVLRGTGQCSVIKNSEMRNACSAPGAASPLPPTQTYYGG